MAKKILAFVLAGCMLAATVDAEIITVHAKERSDASVQEETDVFYGTGLLEVQTEELTDYSGVPLYDTSGDDGMEVEQGMLYSAYYGSSWDSYKNYYFYNQMSEEERAYWDRLDTMCMEFLTTGRDANGSNSKYYLDLLTSDSLTADEMKSVCKIFRYNNPQYYFLNSSLYSCTEDEKKYYALGVYTLFADGEERAEETAKVKEQIDVWQEEIDACDTVEQKVKLIHDLVVQKVEYNSAINQTGFNDDTQYSQSVYSVLCTDLTVCAGYAQTFELLCNAAGIDAVAVTSATHEWNKVRIADSWYNVDCTWDDQSTTIYTFFERSDVYYDTSSTNSRNSHAEESFWDGYLPLCTLDSNPTTSVSPGTLPEITEETDAPNISLKSEIQDGSLTGMQYVTITCGMEDASIYYTTDGTIPVPSSAKCFLYREPFLADTSTIRAVAVCDTFFDSNVAVSDEGQRSYRTVSYDGNGATAGSMDTQAYDIGDSVVLRQNAFSRTGYRFTGWNTSPDGKGILAQAGEEVADFGADVTLYAQWSAVEGDADSITDTNASIDTDVSSDAGKDGQTARSIREAVVTLSKTQYAYDGSAKKPSVTVSLDGEKLVFGSDYTVSYQNNKKIGTATVRIQGMGSYTGTVDCTFAIQAKTGSIFALGGCEYRITGESSVAVKGLKNTKKKTVEIPKKVTIGGKDFLVTAIDAKAFRNQKKLTSIVIGSQVTKIGASAFSGCTGLKKVTIGTGVRTIGKNAFYGCGRLSLITVKSTRLKSVGANALKKISSSVTIRVPSQKYKAYRKLFQAKGQSGSLLMARM